MILKWIHKIQKKKMKNIYTVIFRFLAAARAPHGSGTLSSIHYRSAASLPLGGRLSCCFTTRSRRDKLFDQFSEKLDVFGAGGKLSVLAGGDDLHDFIVDGCFDAVLSAEVADYAVDGVDLAGLTVLQILEH